MPASDPTKRELLEILAQLGVPGHSEDDDIGTLHTALVDAGLDEETITAEVEEQRGRIIPGRPE